LPAHTAQQTSAAQTYTDQANLSYSAGILECTKRSKTLWSSETPGAIPYKIVATCGPGVVTTCGETLEPATWVIRGGPHLYRGMLPQVAGPALTALAELPGGEEELAGRLVVLDSQGNELHDWKSAELLMPYTGENPSQHCLVVIPGNGDAITPYGAKPRFVMASTESKDKAWEVALPASLAVAGVELWACGAYCVVSVQYGYDQFEFFTISITDGAIKARAGLAGQPAYQSVYPGPENIPSSCRLLGDRLSVMMLRGDAPVQEWTFDLKQGTISTRDRPSWNQGAAREVNRLPVGGKGAPGQKSVLFPQRLLPEAGASGWEIPALQDSSGRILVITQDGASWKNPAKMP
jgi:hypothetical protein